MEPKNSQLFRLTLNLNEGTNCQFQKPTDETTYTYVKSNHPR